MCNLEFNFTTFLFNFPTLKMRTTLSTPGSVNRAGLVVLYSAAALVDRMLSTLRPDCLLIIIRLV